MSAFFFFNKKTEANEEWEGWTGMKKKKTKSGGLVRAEQDKNLSCRVAG